MPAEPGAATVTIIVAPGQRFSLAPRSLRSLAAHTAPPFQLVYVDAGSPVAVRNEIAALAAVHGFTVIRNERPLPPNRARNLGLAAATGDVVVFTANDLLFTPGWLPPLLDGARETGAGLVSPVILIGGAREGRIGFAGGDLVIDRTVEPSIAAPTDRFAGRRVADVAGQLSRTPSDYGALSCVLARRDLLQRVGPLDELTRKSYVAAGATKLYLEFFTIAGLIYLLLTIISMLLLTQLERYASRGVRRGV